MPNASIFRAWLKLTQRRCHISLSDIKTFTSRDLSRAAAKVLAASDVDGVAEIRTRDGRRYELRPVEKEKGSGTWTLAADIDRHCQRVGELKAEYGVPPLTKTQWREMDRLITERAL